MRSNLLLVLFLTGCGPIEKELAPEVILIEGELEKDLKELVEITVKEKLCDAVLEEGFECNIPEQLKSLKVEWVHNGKDEAKYYLEFCLKSDCPLEEQE